MPRCRRCLIGCIARVDPMEAKRRTELPDRSRYRMLDGHEEASCRKVRIVKQIGWSVQRGHAPLVDLCRSADRALGLACQPHEECGLHHVGQFGICQPRRIRKPFGQRSAVTVVAAEACAGERLHHPGGPRRQGEHQRPSVGGGVEADRRRPLRLARVSAHIGAGPRLVQQVGRSAVDGARLRLERRHIDVKRAAAALAHLVRRQGRYGRQVADLIRGDVAAELDGLALVDAGAPHRSAHGVGHDVAAAVAGLSVRAGLPERCDRGEHDAGSQVGESLVPQSDAVQMAWREGFDDDV